MQHFNVTGMSCAACQQRVEKAVSSLEGVESCAVSLLTNSMAVEGSCDSQKIIKAVEKAGYKANLKGSEKETRENFETESSIMKRRLIVSLIFLIPLMYVSMGHMLFGFKLPEFLDSNPLAIGIYEMLLSGLILVINQKFFINGFRGLLNKAPNMDTLVAMGSGASYIYSVYSLFLMTESSDKTGLMNELYFESAGMILVLITFGKLLEQISKGRTTDALKALMKLAPRKAVILEDGVEKEIRIEDVRVGDRFVVKPGDSVPVDGIVIEGQSAVNESCLTGESLPVEKNPGDTVSAATINSSGYMICEARRVGEDTTLAGIIRMVSDASQTKAPIAKIADKVSGIFVPAVMTISLITFIGWLFLGYPLSFSLTRAVSVLVISCPCALGLATPVAIMVGNGVAARNGILFKTAESLEMAGKIKILALDKTGTITKGVMKVTDIVPCQGISEKELLKLAYSLEIKSEHPLARAIVEYAASINTDITETRDFEALPGNGLKAYIADDLISAGNASLISDITGINKEFLEEKTRKFSLEGKTPILFSKAGRLYGIIAVADTIKEDSPRAIRELRKMGIHTVMLTGDNSLTAQYIAGIAGIEEVRAGVTPAGKELFVRELSNRGMVMMAGDGINDAPSLTRADVSVAVGAGTDIAIDAASIVLIKNSLMDIVEAVRISRKVIRNIHENLFWAFFYNVTGIPLAMGLYIIPFGLELSPMFGAFCMGLSSFCVVMNALRLNLLKPIDHKINEKEKNINTEKGNAVNENIISDNTLSDNTKNMLSDNTEEAYKEYGNKKDEKIKEETEGKRKEEKTEEKGKKKEEKTEEKGKKKEVKIKVEGMMCHHCEMHVKEALENTDGIISAAASFKEGTVIVSYEYFDEEKLKSSVKDAGYTYSGIIEESDRTDRSC